MANEDHQAEADAQDQTPVADPSADVANSTNGGTNTALDDWHASVAALDLDESSEPAQGEQPADEESEDPEKNESEPEESEEQEQISEEEPEGGEEEPEPEAKASKRIRVTDPTDQKVAAVAKAMGINFVEAAKIVEAQSSTKHQGQEQSQEAVDTVDSVQARLEELEDLEATASTALEFETANEHRKEANKLRNKLMDLKIAEVQSKANAEQADAAKFYADYAKSEEKTVGLYPDAAKADSPMAKEMVRLEAEMQELGDPLYHSADKPFILAREAAKNLGIPMKKPGSAPAKKTVQHRPIQPAGGNARTTTTDPAKRTSEEIDGIGSMRDWRETVASL